VSKDSVRRDTAGVANETPATITGRDGKSYLARKPAPAPVLDFPEQPQQAPAITRQQADR
jgi:hypothetical protein